MASITLDNVSKQFPNGHHAVRAAQLTIANGEFVVLVGPSGCGKSTLLRLIAGLETPTNGRILLDDRDVTMTPPQERDVAMVFQSYALYPHLSIRDNLAYGLRIRKLPADESARRINAVAEALDLAALLDRRPAQLSGGQRQRVALGRAMVREPQAFLFDEPLSNLDPALRAQSRAELLQLHRRLATTMVYVTHDQEEAMTLAQRVAVMRAGVIEQSAPPLDVYARPVNTFVAQFIGSPPMNLLPIEIAGVSHADATLVGIRPHDVLLDAAGPMTATVDVVEPRGHDAVVHLSLRGNLPTKLVAVVPASQIPAPDTNVNLRFREGATHLFDGSHRAVMAAWAPRPSST